jgi:hypothetical protein
METLIQDTNRAKIQKELVWLTTIIVLIAGLPLLKNAIAAILVKLYELLIQRAQ